MGPWLVILHYDTARQCKPFPAKTKVDFLGGISKSSLSDTACTSDSNYKYQLRIKNLFMDYEFEQTLFSK